MLMVPSGGGLMSLPLAELVRIANLSVYGFSDLVSFYEPLSNYSIDETNQTINLEYYVRKDGSNVYSKDTTYTLTLSIKEEKVHLQKHKNV